MSDAAVVEIKPYDPAVGMLVPFVVQRVLETARIQCPESEPESMARGIVTRLYQGDPTQLVLALLNGKSQVVGHAVASVGMDQSKCWATILQLRCDGNVGNSQKEAAEAIKTWAQTKGATKLVLLKGKGERPWEEEMGFKVVRQIAMCDIELK